jgi:alanine dehydrogenase
MVLLLTADEVGPLLDMSRAIDLLEAVAREHGAGTASDIPSMGGSKRGTLRLLGGSTGDPARAGLRVGLHGAVSLLFDVATWEPLAVMGAPFSRLRVGASAGVAARFLARPDASSVGMLGSGKNALAILTGLCVVRPIRRAVVYSPSGENRASFARQASKVVGISVEPVDSRDEALRDVDIVAVMTSAVPPVLAAEDLRLGWHVTSLGMETELDASVYLHADQFVATTRELEIYNTDPASNPPSRQVPPLYRLLQEGRINLERIVPLCDIVTGRTPVRNGPNDITVYRDSRAGTHEVAFLSYVYDRAREQGLGVELDLGSEARSTWRPRATRSLEPVPAVADG